MKIFVFATLILIFCSAAFAVPVNEAMKPVRLEIYYNKHNYGVTGFPGFWASIADRPGLIMEGKTHITIIPADREVYETLKALDPAQRYTCDMEGTLNKGDEFIPFHVVSIHCQNGH